jgi:hypothetical protein
LSWGICPSPGSALGGRKGRLSGPTTSFDANKQKANLLWTAFKNRMGISEYSGISYNLSTILTEHNLDHLDSEFSTEEIEQIIKTLPNSYAPGPDGFNNLFIKKC